MIIEYSTPPFDVIKVAEDIDSYFIKHVNEVVTVMVCGENIYFLLIYLWRPALNKAMWEFPAGGLEPGESPIDAAARELCEEVGLVVPDMKYLGFFYASSGSSNQVFHMVLASIPSIQRSLSLNTSEGILDYKWVSFNKLNKLILNGEVATSHTMIPAKLFNEEAVS